MADEGEKAWASATVAQWLVNAGLESHVQNFGDMASDVFRSLLMQDYAKYGVTKLEDKQKLFRLVKSLQMPPPAKADRPKAVDEPAADPPAKEKADPPAGAELFDLDSEEPFSFDGQGASVSSALCSVSPEVASKVAPRIAHRRPSQPSAPTARAAGAPAPQRIKVCVRKRPLNRRERDRNEDDIMFVHGDQSTALTVNEPKMKVDLTKYTEKHEFRFDHVFDINVSNEEIYGLTVENMLPVMYAGGRASCFAFGQTGSGKTYTMNPLPPRCAADLFEYLSQPGMAGKCLTLSIFEIYGSKVFDLLNARNLLVMREDGKKNVNIVGLQEKRVSAIEEVHHLLNHAASVRSTGCTGANSESSRSHCIISFSLRHASAPPPSNGRLHRAAQPQSPFGKMVGKISFIDLAGSERGADTYENDKQTRIEGAQINKSLLALKECIRALDQCARHIPFRGSKLTEVLRDSFTGQSVSVMIANIAPSTSCCENSLNTLRYADRVKEMKKDRSSSFSSQQQYQQQQQQQLQQQQYQQYVHQQQQEHELRVGGAGMDRAPKQVLSSSGQSNPNGHANGHAHPVSDMEAKVGKGPRAVGTAQAVARDQGKENLYASAEGKPKAFQKEHKSLAEKVDVEEEVVIAAHRQLIEQTMDFVRTEMSLLADVDQPGSSIEKYVADLNQILSSKMAGIAAFQKKLASFETNLKAPSVPYKSQRG